MNHSRIDFQSIYSNEKNDVTLVIQTFSEMDLINFFRNEFSDSFSTQRSVGTNFTEREAILFHVTRLSLEKEERANTTKFKSDWVSSNFSSELQFLSSYFTFVMLLTNDDFF